MKEFEPIQEHFDPQIELKATFTAIRELEYNPDGSINEPRFNAIQGRISDFRERIGDEKKYTRDQFDGSVSYHMLTGSTVQEDKKLTPDPLFDEVNMFVKETLAFIALPPSSI